MFIDPPKIYLHKQPVDFRKSINGLSLLVEQDMQQSPFSGALFVFCNRQRTRLKVMYWDSTGFCLWYKRLENPIFRGQRATVLIAQLLAALTLLSVVLKTCPSLERFVAGGCWC
ncbi:IS66 family insertion sequence element accessory protein TnpB [Rheinheimera gaetbuli]